MAGGPAQCCARGVAPVLLSLWESSRKAFGTRTKWLEIVRVTELGGVKPKVKPRVKAFTKKYLRAQGKPEVASSGSLRWR